MRNVTNIFIVNLSCSDILVCLVCLPVTIIYTLMDRWILGEALCKVTPFVQCMSVTVSIFSMVLIALERHQLIIHPTGWKPVVRHSYLAVAVIWIVACFISLPFLSFNILTNSPFHNLSLPFNPFSDHFICIEQWPSEGNRLTYTTTLLLCQYCLPLALILVCYFRIFCVWVAVKTWSKGLEVGGRKDQRFKASQRHASLDCSSVRPLLVATKCFQHDFWLEPRSNSCLPARRHFLGLSPHRHGVDLCEPSDLWVPKQ